MVAGYHDSTHASAHALVDRSLYLRTDGVDHAGESHKAQVVLKLLRLEAIRLTLPHPHCTGENSQSLVGHCLVCPGNFFAILIRHRHGLAVFHVMGTSVDYNIGRTLCVLHNAVMCKMHGAHHLASRVKRCLAAAGKILLEGGLVVVELICPDDQRCFGRFAGDDTVGVNFGIGAQRHCLGDKVLIVAEEVDDRHFVLRQRAGLIRADYLCAAEGLDRRKLADDGVAL